MIFAGIIILSLYIITMAVFFSGNRDIYDFSISENDKVSTTFSVIIPFRNEAENLSLIFKSIEELNYPEQLVEFLFVNDNSTDESEKLVEQFVKHSRFIIKLLQREKISKSPKKDAITIASINANNDWFITTDADCLLPKNWLLAYNHYIMNNKVDLVASSVKLFGDKSLIHQFQILEHLSLQTVTIGAFGFGIPIMCNGANLAYKKQLFNELNGFDGNNHLASGDDLFILEKAKRSNKNVGFLLSKESIVSTSTEDSFISLLQQRIRWASKTRAYKNWFATWTAWITLLVNLKLVVLIIFWLSGNVSSHDLFGLFAVKCVMDFLCIFFSATFQKQTDSLGWFPLSALIYPFWTVFIGLASLRKTYTWKDRKLQ